MKVVKIYYYVILGNMKKVIGESYSEKGIRCLVRKNLENYFQTSYYIKNWKRQIFNQKVEWINFEKLEKTLKKYKVIITCSFHYGNYYIFPVELAKLGYKIKVIVGRDFRQINFINECIAQKKLDIEPIIADGRTLIKLVRSLNDDRCIIYILIDEFGGVKSNQKLLRLTFLDQQCQVKKGIGWLQHISQLPIVPIVNTIKDNNRSIIKIERIILPNHNYMDRENVITTVMKRLFNIYEYNIIKYPSQWLNWVNWKRYESKSNEILLQKNYFKKEKHKNDILKISKKNIKIIRYKNEIYIIDINNGKYFVTNEVGEKIIKLLFNGINLIRLDEVLRRNNYDLSSRVRIKNMVNQFYGVI